VARVKLSAAAELMHSREEIRFAFLPLRMLPSRVIVRPASAPTAVQMVADTVTEGSIVGATSSKNARTPGSIPATTAASRETQDAPGRMKLNWVINQWSSRSA